MEKNRNSNSAQSVKTGAIIKSALSDTFKKHKKLVKALIAIVVLIAAAAAAAGVLSISSVQEDLFNSLIPSSIEHEELGVVFYSEKNPDYESGSGQSIKCYYYLNNDKSSEKIYLEDGIYHTGSDEIKDVNVVAGFTFSAMLKVRNIVSSLKWVAVAFAVLAVVLVIVFWYKSFKKRELEEREKYRKSHPRR